MEADEVRADFPAIFRLFDKDDADPQCDHAWDALDLVGPKDEEYVEEIVRIISSRADQMEKRMWCYTALQHIRGRDDEAFRKARDAALRAGPAYVKVWIWCFWPLEQFNSSKPREAATPSDLARLSIVFAVIPLVAYGLWLAWSSAGFVRGPGTVSFLLQGAIFYGCLAGPIAVVVGMMSFVQQPKGRGGLGIILGVIAATIGFSSGR